MTALYEVKFQDDAQGTAATVFVRYQDPDSGEVVELNRSIDHSQFSDTFETMSARFQLDAAVAEYAEILRESYWAQDSSMGAVSRLAREISERLPDDPDVAEFASLVEQAWRLADMGG